MVKFGQVHGHDYESKRVSPFDACRHAVVFHGGFPLFLQSDVHANDPNHEFQQCRNHYMVQREHSINLSGRVVTIAFGYLAHESLSRSGMHFDSDHLHHANRVFDGDTIADPKPEH